MAYAEFSSSVSSLDAGAQHGLAHAFGGALYEAVGVAGIAICDAQFTYGCYHQFIGEAIAANGLGVTTQIDDVCKKLSSPIPCRHGIGHGLVGYLGYTSSALKRAVSQCVRIDDDRSLQGCLGGAFMEYNMRTIATSSQGARTPEHDLYAPCDAYAGMAAESCYVYQPQWWWTVFSSSSSPAEVFARMDALCAGLTGQSRESCYRGVGLMAPPQNNYAASGTIRTCLSLQGTADQANCLIGAAVVLEGTSHDTDAAGMCEGLSQLYKDECLSYAQGRINL